MAKNYVTNPPIRVLKPLPPKKESKTEEQAKAKKKSKKKENGKG